MVVAETRGLLRPIAAGDSMGHVRENAIFRQLQREAAADAAELRFLRECASAQYLQSDTEMEIFRHHRDAAHKQYLAWLSQRQPYMDWATKLAELEQEDLSRDVKKWEDEFGSLSDPEVQAETERLTDWLKHGYSDVEQDEEM